MRVGDEQEIDLGKFADGKRREHVAARAGGHKAQADADAVEENGIGEDCHAADADQDAGMTKPCGGERGIFPAGQIRGARRGGRDIKLIKPAQAASASA